MSFISILCFAGRFDSTDPRDQLYALLGLGTIHEGQVVKPNYRLDRLQVSKDFVISVLTVYKRLDVLPYAAYRTRSCLDADSHPDWPSWAPDWNRTVTEGTTTWCGHVLPYRSTRDFGAQSKVAEDDKNVLCVLGKTVDIVKLCGQSRCGEGLLYSLRWLEECSGLLVQLRAI